MPRMPSPFDATVIHPLARRAASELLAELAAGPPPVEGKMYGVLVVRFPDGREGVLRAFSGMLGGSWHAPGFVPPAFDEAVKGRVWPAGEEELAALEARRAALLDGPERGRLVGLDEMQRAELAALRERHRAAKQARAAARVGATAEQLHALAQQSRGDTAEEKRLLAAHAEARRDLAAAVAALDAERASLDERRAARSRELLHAIYDSYVFADANGNRRALRDLFAPAEPPGGSGDCAAPKLFAHAYRLGATPVAVAEVWFGPGDRRSGAFYPACRGKCGPILAHVLRGLDVEPPPVPGDAPVPAHEPRVVFEDETLLVVEKPVGLLSVPGRSGRLRDSVETRLRARIGDATRVVHRLDLDTSGLLLAAKEATSHTALQAAFARREVDKRYVAILDGVVAADTGSIDLALRVDLDDRPRQIVDAIHGKPALTEFRVLSRTATQTRISLIPRTGRTHQLRVHCAQGLAAPIAGDRLYGTFGPRLLLHAAHLSFVHPRTGARITLDSPAAF